MIVSLGEALFDLIHAPGEGAPRAQNGGSPYNVAIALARLGHETGFLCPLSSDAYGRQLARGLEEAGVQICVTPPVSAPTAIAEVETDSTGHPRYTFHRVGTADRSLQDTCPADWLPKDLKALHFGSLALAQGDDWPAWREAVVRAREGGALIAFDPNLRTALIDDLPRYRLRVEEAVELAHLIKASDEDMASLAPGVAPERHVQGWLNGARTVVLTRGPEGAELWGPHGQHARAGSPIQGRVVDTVGAGDTFQAALISRLLQEDLHKAGLRDGAAKQTLEYACRAAALNCARAGCDPPTRAEVEQAL